jgi:raffinose/stachyose/melibiose transport system permease protein
MVAAQPPAKSPPLAGRAVAGTRGRRPSPYPYWFVLPGGLVFALLFLTPTLASFR